MRRKIDIEKPPAWKYFEKKESPKKEFLLRHDIHTILNNVEEGKAYTHLVSHQLEELTIMNRFLLYSISEVCSDTKSILNIIGGNSQKPYDVNSHERKNFFPTDSRNVIQRGIDFVKGWLNRFQFIENNSKAVGSEHPLHNHLPCRSIDAKQLEAVFARFEEFSKTQTPSIDFRIVHDLFYSLENAHKTKIKNEISRAIKKRTNHDL